MTVKSVFSAVRFARRWQRSLLFVAVVTDGDSFYDVAAFDTSSSAVAYAQRVRAKHAEASFSVVFPPSMTVGVEMIPPFKTGKSLYKGDKT